MYVNRKMVLVMTASRALGIVSNLLLLIKGAYLSWRATLFLSVGEGLSKRRGMDITIIVAQG